MMRYQELIKSGQWVNPRYKTDKSGNFINVPDVFGSDVKYETMAEQARRKKTRRTNVEQYMNIKEAEASGDPDVIAVARRQNNQFIRELGALRDDAFEDYAETFEDAIWYGTDIQNSFMREKINSNNLFDDELVEPEHILTHRRPDQYPAVDIWIVSGDTDNHSANHSVEKIVDLSFTGKSKSITVSGEPIIEVYPFIAKNLV